MIYHLFRDSQVIVVLTPTDSLVWDLNQGLCVDIINGQYITCIYPN